MRRKIVAWRVCCKNSNIVDIEGLNFPHRNSKRFAYLIISIDGSRVDNDLKTVFSHSKNRTIVCAKQKSRGNLQIYASVKSITPKNIYETIIAE